MVDAQPVFCDDCIAATSDVGTGNIGSINGTGARWYGAESPCPRCGSVIKTLRPSLFWIPLPIGAQYRVIELGGDRFIARALRDFASGADKVIILPTLRPPFLQRCRRNMPGLPSAAVSRGSVRQHLHRAA